jgi:hypothetical protein
MLATDGSDLRAVLSALLRADGLRMRLLAAVETLELRDCWIGAGFVRAAVWDHLHGRPASAPDSDLDVVWFDPAYASEQFDRATEVKLRSVEPSARWSVKNQARMHARNGDAPYMSTEDSLLRWPETATAVAVRAVGANLETLAPHGLDDLFAMIVRPTPHFAGDKLPEFLARVRQKRWLERWPLLRVEAPSTRAG